MPSNEVDEFLGGLKEEVKDPFKPEVEADPFATAPVEEEKPAEEEKEEKPLPFHRDPKVQRFIEKELDKRLRDVKPTATEQFVKETAGEETEDLVGAFTAIIGNDTPEKVHALKMLRKSLDENAERASERAFQRLEEIRQREVEAEREATAELDSGFENIEETYGVDITSNAPAARKVRAEFVEFIERISPKDEYGNVVEFPDLVEAFDVFKERKAPAQPSRAKELAARSMTRATDTTTAPPSGDKSWAAVDRLFNKLSS